MSTVLRITAMFIALGCSQRVVLSQEKSPEQVVRDIVSVWKAKHSEVKTVICQTTVDAFIPQHGYTNQNMIWKPREKDVQPFPKEDTWVKGEFASWTIDYEGGRARKEWRLTRPRLLTAGGKECGMVPTTGVAIFAEKKFREFRPRDGNWTSEERTNKASTPDVYVYDDHAHQFYFTFSDLPLLWYGGCVTGLYPSPDRMRELDVPERFRLRGQIEYNERTCFVLTVPDQGSPTDVRELYVDTEPPYLIHAERARGDKQVHWTVEVKYHVVGGRQVLKEWKHTEFCPTVDKIAKIVTYRVDRFAVNELIPDSAFDLSLKPDDVIYHAEKNDVFEVDPQGELVPYKGPSSETRIARRWLWASLGIGAVLCVALLVWWRARRLPKSEGSPPGGSVA